MLGAAGDNDNTAVQNAVDRVADGGTVALGGDFAVDAVLLIPYDKKVTIDLHGQTLYVSDYINIRYGAELTLINSTVGGGQIMYAEKNPDYPLILVQDSGKLILNSGVFITGNKELSGSDGTGVELNFTGVDNDYRDMPMFIMNGGGIRNAGTGVDLGNGKFVMNGGSIYNNTDHGVIVRKPLGVNAEFEMTGGEMYGNYAGYGGAVEVYGKFTMSGGKIHDNTAGTNGGGVHLRYDSEFIMTGGEISGNKAMDYGGGICLSFSSPQDKYLRLSGSPVISGNTVNNKANNVFLWDGFTLEAAGSLSSDARIGVTLENPNNANAFTTGLSGKGTAANFFSDNSDYAVFLNDSGEAQLLRSFTVTFDGNGGTGTMSDVVQASGASYTLPDCGFTAPENKEFDCWEIGGTEYNAGGTITMNGNITLKAIWRLVRRTVSFDVNGHGTAPNAQVVEYGMKASEPEAPQAEGYTFGGWYKEAGFTNAWNFEEAVTSDVTLYAKWTAVAYTIGYDLAGGNVSPANPESYMVESPDFTLNNPARTGYGFAGWTGTGLTKATETVTIARGSTGARSYTANWTLNTYTIESPDFTLNNPTKAGQKFMGWTGTDLAGASRDVTIKQGSTGSRSYTATWGDYPNTYNVSTPPGLSITQSGWNSEAGVITASADKEDFDPDKKIVITVTSPNDWYLVDSVVSHFNPDKIHYTLKAKSTDENETTSWTFTSADLFKSGGTTITFGAMVDDFSNNRPGSYEDPVEFHVSIE